MVPFKYPLIGFFNLERLPTKAKGGYGKCVKCTIMESVVAVRQATYCKACFLVAFAHKFRTQCAKSKSPKEEQVEDQVEDHKILLCFSGGLSSRLEIWIADLFYLRLGPLCT